MKVGVLGSGDVGKTLGAGFAAHGHEVMIGTRNPGDKAIKDWVAKTPRCSAGTFADAARFGEMVVLAVLGRIADKVVDMAGKENLAGKTLMDATNPIADSPPIDGVLQWATGPNQSLGEKIQKLAAKAHVVKTFNSVGSARMVNPHYEQGTPTMFLCGDNEAAKEQVSGIIRQFGWEPFDCGGIIAARALEPLCMLWCIPGFRKNQWTHAFKLLTR